MGRSVGKAQQHFLGGTKAALDRPVHITLPFLAGMFAGKEHSLVREGQDLALRWWKPWVKQRVTAARPGVVLPADALGGDQTGGTNPKERTRSAKPRVPSAASRALVASLALPPASKVKIRDHRADLRCRPIPHRSRDRWRGSRVAGGGRQRLAPQGRRRRSTPMRSPQHSMCHGFRLLRISARNLAVSKLHGLSTTFRQSSSLFKNIS